MTDERPDCPYVVVRNEFEFIGFAYDALEAAAAALQDDSELLRRLDVASSYLKAFHEALYGAHLAKYPGMEPPETI